MKSMILPYNYLYRIIFVGDPYVGKTALAATITSDTFPILYNTTIGIDFFSMITLLNNDAIIKSHIWDTAGQECYLSIVKSYFRDTIAVFILYDVSKRITFKNVPRWLQHISDIDSAKKFFVLIGNKTDMKREVSEEEGREFAQENGLLFFETTKKDKTCTRNMFHDVIRHIYTRMVDKEHPGIKKYEKSTETLDLVEYNPPPTMWDCCSIS